MKRQMYRVIACLTLCALLAGAVPPASAAGGFRDVPDSHPAAEAIRRCVELGFFQGESATRFGMGHSITRGAFAVAASRFLGWDTKDGTKTPTYSDVPADAWFAPYVEEAYDKGIVEGIGNGQFGPNTNISRQDFAVMTVRMLGKEAEAEAMKDSPISFSDTDRIAGYAKGAVAYCAANKILNGYDTGKFEPTLTITREEAAKILAVAKGLEVTGTPDFADNSRISGWAQPYVAAVQAAGIFKGDEANRFNPQQKITRAETAKVMVESLKK